MAMTPGLVPNLRLDAPPASIMPDAADIPMSDDDGSAVTDDRGNVIRIEHDDGSISISLDGRPLDGSGAVAKKDRGWFDNLVDDIDAAELSRISEELLRGVWDDLTSRAEWIEDRTQGIKLLGLKIELPNIQGASDGAPVEGMSRVRHPLLLEAVLRFQANARAELLPTDGPVKIRDDGNGSTVEQDELANALQKDLNHYLTSTAKEYYPDTDQMLLKLGFGGTAFKKVYFCPLRNRPVSETVDVDDLIVNNAATDLSNAKRVTQRIMMRPSTVKRMQLIGAYRDVDLATPNMVQGDSLKRAEREQQGISDTTSNPEDRDREIYECYCELDLKGYEHRYKGKDSGLEIPYCVTIDVSSREILSIVRNYDEDTAEMPEARANFVKYTFVPGFGFYDIGLLHILGNTTNAITAAWRELLDAGMYACFPGFLFSDAGGRQNSNIFRVPPGGGAQIKTGGMPIGNVISNLPYKEPSSALMSLVDNIATTGMRIGGTSEAQVGEGRADAPVGTTLAMIDQATKVLNSVHKRMHAAQAQEFQLLVRCFKEHPDSFWQRLRKPAYKWDEATFLQALEDCDLVPQADPNTASHGQRVMKIMGLKQLQQASPTLYDPLAIDKAALAAMGWSNPEQFLAPPEQAAQPTPEAQKELAKAQSDAKNADARMMDAQTKAAMAQHAISQPPDAPAQQQEDTPVDKMDATARLISAHAKAKQVGMQAHDIAIEDQNRDKDRASRENIAALGLAKDIMIHKATQAKAAKDE